MADLKLAKAKLELAKFYISFLGGSSPVEFGWGKCPYKQYLVSVVATDQFGNRLSDIRIFVANNDTGTSPVPEGSTGKDGIYQVYCDNGNYTISGYGPDGYKDASSFVVVNNGLTVATLVLEVIEKNTVTPGIMTCNVYYAYNNTLDFDEYDYGGIVGTAAMNILSDKEAVFSMKFTVDAFRYNSEYDSWYDEFNNYDISFGEGNWENHESLFHTGYSNDFSTPGEYIKDGIHYYPNMVSNGIHRDYDNNYEVFPCSDIKEDMINQEVSWKITVSEAVDFSFYDLEDETMIATVEFLAMG